MGSLRLISTVFELDRPGRTQEHSFKFKKRRISTDLRQHFFSKGLSTYGTHWTMI